jgi:hypothetical protein
MIYYISLGGWCGTRIALKDLNLNPDLPNLPFDHVRISIEGVIDCIENNFENFFPKIIEIEKNYVYWKPFIGEFVGFYHHNLFDTNVIESFNRKFVRFNELLNQKEHKIIFLRTICRENYKDEIKHSLKLQQCIEKKYPDLSFILIFIIADQDVTDYYCNVNSKIFIFSLNDKQHSKQKDNYDLSKLKNEYEPIIFYLQKNDLFNNVYPKNNLNIHDNTKLWYTQNRPVVKHVEKSYDGVDEINI